VSKSAKVVLATKTLSGVTARNLMWSPIITATLPLGEGLSGDNLPCFRIIRCLKKLAARILHC
jgi:hypothetical protein